MNLLVVMSGSAESGNKQQLAAVHIEMKNEKVVLGCQCKIQANWHFFRVAQGSDIMGVGTAKTVGGITKFWVPFIMFMGWFTKSILDFGTMVEVQ